MRTGRLRTSLAAAAAVGVAALGGAVLGEYTIANLLAVLAGAIFGIVVGEAALALQGRPRPATVAAAGLATPAAWVWSLWISTGHLLSYATAAQWAAVPVTGLVGAGWVATRGLSRGRDR